MATSNPMRNTQEYIKLPLLYNHWYVAGLADEFHHELIDKTILERSIVFYRKGNGELVALQNRCAHRSFPLSKSKLIGDNIRCGYHGIVFNSDGQIVEVPCQTNCPRNAGVLKYAVAERGPLVWIWMGDPADAKEDDIPETDCLTNSDWTAMWGKKELEGNYLLMHENLADLSHLPFLHETTFGASEDWAEVPVEVEREGDSVHYWRSTTEWSMAAPLYPPTVKLDQKKIEGKLGATFVSPAMCRGWTRVEVIDPKDGEQKSFLTEINHYLTPEKHNAAHYYWSFARNCDIRNQEYSDAFKEVVSAAFDEDRVATKEMQTLLDEDKHNITDINIASDKSTIAVRMSILDMFKREHDTDTGSSQ